MRIIGVDTGGTFTDFIYRHGDTWGVHKRLSTPDNPARAVLEGLAHIEAEISGKTDAAETGRSIVHGSTVATNAILERKGVRTALITNAGFEDVIEIGRQNRAELYNLAFRKEPHIVPPELRFGVPGRISSEGEEIEPFDEQAAEKIARKVKASKAESVAVCFLFSFLHPEHENRMREILQSHGLLVSVSHEILAEFREFERTSTLVVNAYVSPKMTRYLTELKEAVSGDILRVMQSNGGSISADTAMSESVRTILSGPAGGAVGALEIGRTAGFDKLITFDMGGTSTDVALIDRSLPLTLESSISGYPVKVPMIDIHTVGAGGGSIASLDAGGALSVGPESAGADPGPVCYGKGKRITVTDANLYLGRLSPDHFLGGGMRLNAERLHEIFEKTAARAGMGPEELAEGILAVADTAMERAVRVISVEKGYDPREFTLFSFGGAGGMHCVSLAKLLGIPRVLVPVNPGILSAAGMAMADVIKDFSRTVMLDAADISSRELAELFLPLEYQGTEALEAEGFAPGQVTHQRFLDMRYQGQSFEIITPLAGDPIEAFETLHERQYGYRNPRKPVEIVNIRLRTMGAADTPDFPEDTPAGPDLAPQAHLGLNPVIFDSETFDTPILDRAAFKPGNRFPGPAIITEYSSTIVVPPGAEVEVDPAGNLIIHTEGA